MQPSATRVSCCHLGWWSSSSWVPLGFLFQSPLLNFYKTSKKCSLNMWPEKGYLGSWDLKSQAVPTPWILGFTPYFFQAGVGDLPPLSTP